MNPRRLYRSRDRQLAGVAGGMAEYLDVDPTVIRISWILITVVTGGLALIAYLLLALVIPMSPYPAGTVWQNQAPAPGWSANPGGWAGGAYGTQGWTVPPTASPWPPQAVPVAPRHESRGIGAAAIVGIVLIVIGALALMDVAVPSIHTGAIIGPAILLALGAGLLASSIRRPVEPFAAPAGTPATDPAAAAEANAWSSVPSEMAPWPASNPVPAASSGAARPADSASGQTAQDPDATETDVPTVSGPNSQPPAASA